jgi:hypothetical protein
MIVLNLTHGLAVTQKILGAELSPKGTASDSFSVRSSDPIFVTELPPHAPENKKTSSSLKRAGCQVIGI